MTQKPELETISPIISDIVESSGFELWGLEWTTEQGSRVLRIYIEHEDGVSIDACAKVSRLLGPALDVEELISGAYRLEVSSPGLERPLYTLEQFRKYLGSKARVRLKKPLGKGMKKLSGVIAKVHDEEFVLDSDGKLYPIAIENVKKASLVYEF